MTTPIPEELSERELEILRLVATGASNKEIAHKLVISPNTVKVHLRNIFGKIGVFSRTEAAMYAVRVGLVSHNTVTPTLQPETPGFQDQLSKNEKPDGSAPYAAIDTIQKGPTRWRWYVGLFILIAVVIGGFLFSWARIGFPTPTPSPAATSVIQTTPVVDTDRWKELAALPTPRYGLAVCSLEGQIYAIAGEDENGPLGVNERYDPGTDIWSEMKAKNEPVTDVQAATIGGRIFIPGGRTSSGSPTDILEIYDPLANEWTAGASLPAPRSAYALAAYEGMLYLFGGWDGSEFRSEVYAYDPVEDEWAERSPLPTARGYSGVGVLAGRIFIVGGTDGTQALTANEAYRPASEGSDDGPWSIAAPLPAGRYAMGATSIADILHVMGGVGPGSQTSLEYFPGDDVWRSFPDPYSQERSYWGMVPLEVYLYLIGGKPTAGEPPALMAYQAIYTIQFPLK